jgi:hypothetical protein
LGVSLTATKEHEFVHAAAINERFIRRENVKHYRLLLETVTDEAERQKILKLLAEEQKKQRAAGDPIED